MDGHDAILDFWFDGFDEGTGSRAAARWFGGDAELDETIRVRFGADVEAALAGRLDDWSHTARGRVALVILLDQFTRNAYRGTAAAFSGDARALDFAREAVESGLDHRMRPIERNFLYLPFEHSENAEDQARAVELFRGLAAEADGPAAGLFSGSVDWAVRHQVVIERFGRFPSRNTALGRMSTPEELAFLEEVPSGF
jgi:uncharacterized protein (DUF924 family)